MSLRRIHKTEVTQILGLAQGSDDIGPSAVTEEYSVEINCMNRFPVACDYCSNVAGTDFDTLEGQGFEVRHTEIFGHDLHEPRAYFSKQCSRREGVTGGTKANKTDATELWKFRECLGETDRVEVLGREEVLIVGPMRNARNVDVAGGNRDVLDVFTKLRGLELT